MFKNTILEHWAASEGHWEDHFIMKTQTGQYFRLNASDQESRDDPSMA